MCFLIGVTGEGYSATGDALLGSVSDNPYDVRTFVKTVAPSGGLAHIGTELTSTTHHSLIERGYFARPGETTRGLNEAGLAFTCAMIIESSQIEKPKNPTPFADITEEMMRECTSVDEAIALFGSKGAINPAYSVLLAGSRGDLAHIEVGNFGMAVNHHYSKEQPGAVFAVNCYLSQALINYNAPHTLITNPENNNAARREQGMKLAEKFKGKLNAHTLANLLSDHKNNKRDPKSNPVLAAWGYSICNHGTRHEETYPQEDLPWGTVSAEILEPAAATFWYAYGWPCGQKPKYGDQLFQEKSWGKFVPFTLEGAEEGVIPLTTPYGEMLTSTSRH